MNPSSIFSRFFVLFTTLFICCSFLQAQEIGLQLYSLRNQFKTDVQGTLAKIKEWENKRNRRRRYLWLANGSI